MQAESKVRVELAAKDFRFLDGVAWAAAGYLIFSDVPNERLHKLGPGSDGVTLFREPSGGAAGNAFDAQGRLYTCESKARRVTRTDTRGRVEVLAERWNGKRLNAPNDIAVRRDGSFFFTDPAFGSAIERRELDFNGLYFVSAKGVMALAWKGESRPNGVALSADGKTLFVSNADERIVRAWTVDKDGALSGERVVLSKIEGVPDGLRVDAEGRVFLAARHLLVYAPDGRQLFDIELAGKPSNLTFAHAGSGLLYVTAGGSLYRVHLEFD
ncbi:MAG: SMP-30/gluconolactonase/LRE family protein [Bryobacteraceae bacterium]|nr:SMP-30/gluconolactonase/LRE family protein [Bryobacteraceae bacterium]